MNKQRIAKYEPKKFHLLTLIECGLPVVSPSR